jgi:hypothetical protein
LFLFVADGLSCFIRSKIENNALLGFHICQRAPGISHLLFADDSHLFFEASVDQAFMIKSILDRYEQCTGQMVSLGKCSILYGDQCPPSIQAEVKNILKYYTTCFEEKYLGLPVPEGKMKSGKLKSTKEIFSKHANDWSEKYMSSGAKEVLIKSVLQASLPMLWVCLNSRLDWLMISHKSSGTFGGLTRKIDVICTGCRGRR